MARIITLTNQEFGAMPNSGKTHWDTLKILNDFNAVKCKVKRNELIGISYNHFARNYASRKLKHIKKSEICAILQHLFNLKDDDMIKQKLCVYMRIN